MMNEITKQEVMNRILGKVPTWEVRIEAPLIIIHQDSILYMQAQLGPNNIHRIHVDEGEIQIIIHQGTPYPHFSIKNLTKVRLGVTSNFEKVLLDPDAAFMFKEGVVRFRVEDH